MSEKPLSPMQDKLTKSSKGGALIARKKGATTPFVHWDRDIAHCWALIHCEATTLTQAQLMAAYEGKQRSHEDTDEALTALDKISKYYIMFYSDALECRKGAIGSLPQLHKSLNTDTKREVFALYNAAVVQGTACYLFTSKSMCLGIPEKLDTEMFEKTTAMTMLNLLSDDLRGKVVKEWQEAGYIPSTADTSPIVRATDDYIKIIDEAQEAENQKKSK
jgi:hypothetical protein